MAAQLRTVPGGQDPTALAVRERARRFASLRAAQRALSRTVHPSELTQANEQGRELLIRLQALSVRGGESGARDRAAFARVDQLLDDISRRTREIVDRLEISHLRSIVPLLSEQHPDEVRGLVDLLLGGDLERDKNMRTLEYLVTMLSSEERGGRRIVVHEPSEVTHQLREVTRQRLASANSEDLIAEKTFSSASNMLHAQDDLGLLRDRVRRYKEAIGARILHPATLSAAVNYNVAMWNQVSDLIEGSRSIDHLADELLGIHTAAETGEPAPEPAAAPEAQDARALLESSAFARLEAALRARIGGGAVADADAERVAVACRLDGLLPAEATAFSADADDESARLVRRAVVLGRVLEDPLALEAPLRALGLDPELLAGGCADELRAEMGAFARRLFAESSYDEAFRLSEVKTRNLAALPPAADADPRVARTRPVAPRAGGSTLGIDVGLPAGLGWVLLLLLALPLVAALLWSSGARVSMLSSSDLDQLSPFLQSGRRSVLGERTEFVGVVGPAWEYLEPRQRLRVTAEIGGALPEPGVAAVVLVDRFERVQARYEDGPVLEDRGRSALLRPHAPLPPSGSGLDLGR